MEQLFPVEDVLEVPDDHGVDLLDAVAAETVFSLVEERVQVEAAVFREPPAQFREIVPHRPVLRQFEIDDRVSAIDGVDDFVLVDKVPVEIASGNAGMVTDVRDGDLVDRHLPHEVFRALDDDRLCAVVGRHEEHPFPRKIIT